MVLQFAVHTYVALYKVQIKLLISSQYSHYRRPQLCMTNRFARFRRWTLLCRQDQKYRSGVEIKQLCLCSKRLLLPKIRHTKCIKIDILQQSSGLVWQYVQGFFGSYFGLVQRYSYGKFTFQFTQFAQVIKNNIYIVEE